MVGRNWLEMGNLQVARPAARLRSRELIGVQQEWDGTTPKSKALTPDQQRIQELEARIKRLEDEQRILKKATALFMSDEFKNMRW